jgi:hypothetical protein
MPPKAITLPPYSARNVSAASANRSAGQRLAGPRAAPGITPITGRGKRSMLRFAISRTSAVSCNCGAGNARAPGASTAAYSQA